MPPDAPITVLHYLGYDIDRGGIVAVIRALAETSRFRSLLGVNPGFIQMRMPPMETVTFGRIEGESIRPAGLWRARGVAKQARTWVQSGPRRVIHTHSRAGLLVALWLHWMGETRFLASVHAHGRRPGFYHWLHGILGERMAWLTPTMKRYYRVGDETWSGCLPVCIPAAAVRFDRQRRNVPPAIFGCVGALVPVKNWELVLEALALVPPNTSLRVVHIGEEDSTDGGAAYAKRLMELSRRKGVNARLEWRKGGSDIASFYDGIDCLIVPSRWEASSVAALEAIAAGVPVLVSGGSGTRDLVARCRGGWIFAADSAEALAERMVALAVGPDLASWRRDDEALACFFAPRVAELYAGAYQRLLCV